MLIILSVVVIVIAIVIAIAIVALIHFVRRTMASFEIIKQRLNHLERDVSSLYRDSFEIGRLRKSLSRVAQYAGRDLCLSAEAVEAIGDGDRLIVQTYDKSSSFYKVDERTNGDPMVSTNDVISDVEACRGRFKVEIEVLPGTPRRLVKELKRIAKESNTLPGGGPGVTINGVRP